MEERLDLFSISLPTLVDLRQRLHIDAIRERIDQSNDLEWS